MVILLLEKAEEGLMEKSVSMTASPEKARVRTRSDLVGPVLVNVKVTGVELVSSTEDEVEEIEVVLGGEAVCLLMTLAPVTESKTKRVLDKNEVASFVGVELMEREAPEAVTSDEVKGLAVPTI